MAPSMRSAVAFVACSVAAPMAGATSMEMGFGANPIRKVVTLLQKMQKQVNDESAEADKLFEQYMCYCKNSGGGLQASVDANKAKVPDLEAQITETKSKKEQLEKEEKGKQADRASAKRTMQDAESLRDKEKKSYDKILAENQANYDALTKAVKLISDGMGGGSFLQTQVASKLRSVISEEQAMLEADRETVLAFLSSHSGDEYAPASGEIVGILKQLGDEMYKDQEDMIAKEKAAIADYEGLMEAKTKEVQSQTKFIESSLERISDLGVNLAILQNDLEDSEQALAEDSAFLADLEKNCKAKKGIHEGEQKMRSEEIVAIAETIKVLNDDDALDLFKKTLPSSAASFLQVQVSSKELREEAHQIIDGARSKLKASQGKHFLDFIALALQGKKKGFDEVLEMVDKLVNTLQTEQAEDDDKKSYCEKELDIAEDKHKVVSRSNEDTETVIASAKDTVEKLSEEVEALKQGIKDLDKSVAEATEQRKVENADFKKLMASNGAAKELLRFAKNRLQKFYSPKLHKAAPKRELSEEDRIFENNGGDVPQEAAGGIAGTGISDGGAAASFVQVAAKVAMKNQGAPPPPPETASAYMKKAESSGGVLALIDILVADLDKQMTTADAEEKDAQADYEKTMADSGEKRALDSKTLTDKEAARAETKAKLELSEDDLKSGKKELATLVSYIGSLHSDCDWLLSNYGERKEARTDEVDSLQKAKAVLNGADYSFLQTASSSAIVRAHQLRGSASA